MRDILIKTAFDSDSHITLVIYINVYPFMNNRLGSKILQFTGEY